MIKVNDARALMDYKFYEYKVEEYEKKIEREITRAAKYNNYSVGVTLSSEPNTASEKALKEVLQKFKDNGFEVKGRWHLNNKFIVNVSWK